MKLVQKKLPLILFSAISLFLFLNAIPTKDAFKVSVFAQEDKVKMKISVILVETETEAQKILKKLGEGADFAKLASQHSIGPNREKGGNLGYIAPGYLMEELNAIALNLKIGGYSKIIETDLGYFVLMKTDEKSSSEVISSDSQSLAEQYYANGVDFAAQGKFKKAKEEFEKALKVDPFYMHAKINQKIIEDVTNKKIEIETTIHFFKGVAYGLKEQWDKVIAEFNKAIEINSRFAEAYNNRGIAYFGKGQEDRALSDFKKAIEINPRLAMAYSNRGLMYLGKGQEDQALSDFKKAIEINPRLAMAYSNRGIAYYYKGQYDKAWDDVGKAQSLGHQVHPGFLKDLREASGRQK